MSEKSDKSWNDKNQTLKKKWESIDPVVLDYHGKDI
jgi:hypothetical protein